MYSEYWRMEMPQILGPTGNQFIEFEGRKFGPFHNVRTVENLCNPPIIEGHLWYKVTSPEGVFAGIDGKLYGPYDDMDQFGYEEGRFFFRAVSGIETFAVVDGRECRRFPAVKNHPVVCHMAHRNGSFQYQVATEQGVLVVVDEQRWGPFHYVSTTSTNGHVLVQDGLPTFCVGEKDKSERIVFQGQVHGPFDTTEYSSAGPNLFWTYQTSGGIYAVIEGKKFGPYRYHGSQAGYHHFVDLIGFNHLLNPRTWSDWARTAEESR